MEEKSPEMYFAALKLIEKLHQDGHIPQYMFKNILNDCKDKVDITQFKTYRKKDLK